MSLTQLRKISDVTLQYGVSSRTLRYYEEIGLMESTRESNTSKRFYTPEMLRKLEMILLLKQLQFSIKEIHAILKTDDMLMTIEVFAQKLRCVKNDIVNMMTLKKQLERILGFLRQKGFSKEEMIQHLLDDPEKLKLGVELIVNVNQGNHNKEEISVMNQSPTKLQDHEVRFLELKPMKVAYYHTTINQPEDEAWNVLYA
ncbi:MerR family transcriptional regulator [Paenibacillus sp. 8b26]|uniref:helix-turn-helix domain-containing protein n=1 Tax=Paenibacillus sp. 8b26 TaxID=3424133 RepID=UPI003D662042